MKIAVLIPVYNAEKYLRECLDSVLANAGVDIFAADDGSEDGSVGILEEYAAKNPRVHFSIHENVGVSKTRNGLLDALSADYDVVGFVDSDDWIEPDMYAKLSAALLRDDADVVDCGVWSGDAAKAPNWINVVNKLYRRTVIDGVRFRAGLAFEEDNFFNREVNRNVRKRTAVNEPLYHYRDNPNSSTSVLSMRSYVESVAERVRLTLEIFGPSSELAKDAYRMMIRKNLKKNKDSVMRRELFLFAGLALRRFETEYGFSPAGLNLMQKMIYRCCLQGNHALANILIYLT